MVQLNRLIERLCDAKIDFVVVGGFAGMLHGSTLVTRDLDVCTILSPDAIARLREIFRDLCPRHRFTSQKLSFLDNPEPKSRTPNESTRRRHHTFATMAATHRGCHENLVLLSSRAGARATCYPLRLIDRLRAEIILLADLDAVVAKNAVGRRDVKMDVGQQVIHEIGQALHALGAAAGLPGNGLVFAAIDLRRL